MNARCLFPRCDCPGSCRHRNGVPQIRLWISDYGEIRLPDDFPAYIFRTDGWWDRRYKAVREKWEAWIAVEEAALKMRWNVPDRLHGAVVNKMGEAV